MRHRHASLHPPIRPVRLVHHPQQEPYKSDTPVTDEVDLCSITTLGLIAVSSKIRAPLPSCALSEKSMAEEKNELFPEAIGTRTPPPQRSRQEPAASAVRWRALLKGGLGLLAGFALLFLLSKAVDISSTFALLEHHLSSGQGLLFTCLALGSFLCAFSVRGLRWRLFLLRICSISSMQAIKIYWVAVFLNFLLPVQGGELAKSLILKQMKGVPVSQSLPTVAMDKSLDLMPALLILAAVAFIPSLHMTSVLWAILGVVSGVLIGIILTMLLMAWNRQMATRFVQSVLRGLPKNMGSKLEAFALGFIQSLLDGASRPRPFVLALFLTALALTCDGLFAWCAFQAVGIANMNLEEAIFGYTLVTMFSVLPNPPGQVGSNELVDVLVFAGLLNFPKANVLAMPVLFHPLTAFFMVSIGLFCLASLGLSLKGMLKMSTHVSVL